MNAVFVKILNISITAGWIVLAVILLRFVLKKAPKWIRCVLWGMVALRLLMPFTIESALSLQPSGETVRKESVAVGSEAASGPVSGTDGEIVFRERFVLDSGIPAFDEAVNPVVAKAAETAAEGGTDVVGTAMKAAAYVWATGIGVMLLYALISWLHLRRLTRVSVEAEKGVYLCDEVRDPFILGVIRPKIFLPSGLDEKTWTHVLAHEQAHIRRLDHLWKPLGYLLLSIYWFHPLMWIAFILLSRDIELACDEKVIRSLDPEGKAAYSDTLLAFSRPYRRISACPVAFGEVGVKERVKSVLTYKKPTLWILLTALVAGTVVAVCFLTAPKKTARDTPDAPAAAAAPETEQPAPATPAPVQQIAGNGGQSVDPAPVQQTQGGTIHLYGEIVRDEICTNRELELWDAYYAQGVRDLFVCLPYDVAQYLNLWMSDDGDALLDEVIEAVDANYPNQHYQDFEGNIDLYRAIKEKYPETVFHGLLFAYDTPLTDRYLAYLEQNGREDSEEYAATKAAVSQRFSYFSRVSAGAPRTKYYYQCMCDNFARQYDLLDGRDVVVIVPWAYSTQQFEGNFISQFSQRYGSVLETENLFWLQPRPTETVVVNGKEYTATYCGEKYLNSRYSEYQNMEFWRLEDAIGDFIDCELTGIVLPVNNYPVPVEPDQVFLLIVHRTDGGTERELYRSGDYTWENDGFVLTTTVGILAEP